MACCIPKEIELAMARCGCLDGLKAALPKKRAIRDAAVRHAVLSKPERLVILSVLRRGDQCVCVIKAVVGVPDSKLSYHLSCLRRAGLVTSRRVRSFNYYSLTPEGQRAADELADSVSER